MNEFLNEMNKAILQGGKPALRICITKYFFGENKLLSTASRTDEELIKTVDLFTDFALLYYESGGFKLLKEKVATALKEQL